MVTGDFMEDAIFNPAEDDTENMNNGTDISRLVSFQDWEGKAREILGKGAFDYVSEGAGEELTLLENRRALEKYRIKPRVLMGISDVSIGTTLLGRRYSSPLILAPVGGQGRLHPNGDLETARAAAITDTPFCVSTVSTKSMEAISGVMGQAHRFFQLYLHEDDEFNRSLVKRAEKSGYESIVLTVDGPSIGRRCRSLRNGFAMPEFVNGNFMTEGTSRGEANGGLHKPALKRNLDWGDVDALRTMTRLPIVLKGITHPRDAEVAADHGVEGVVVSNHGGRQLDGVISSIDAISPIREVTDGRIDLILDGGIRTGSDIIKAMCMGAKAVMIGRPYVYGLAVAGSSGVEKVIHDLTDDLKTSMLNAGIARTEDANESYIFRG